MKTRRLIPLFLIWLLPVAAFATAQVPDVLYVDGDTLALYCNPLEPLLKSKGFRPRGPGSMVRSTANWRGYVAYWAVIDGRLVLRDVKVDIMPAGDSIDGRKVWSRRVSVMDSIFPGQRDVVATWFSGHLVLPSGEQTEYVHMGYGSTYERYLLFRVRKGVVIERRTMPEAEYATFRLAQFERYRQTQEYKSTVRQLQKSDDPEEIQRLDDFLFDYSVAEYTSIDFELEAGDQ